MALCITLPARASTCKFLCAAPTHIAKLSIVSLHLPFDHRYDAPFPFGLRHSDGRHMTIAQSVRRLAKLNIPVFAVPESKIKAGQSTSPHLID